MAKIESAIRNPRSAIGWIVLAIVVFFYLSGLTIPLLGPDEARYAQVAREMFGRGEWITPTLGGYVWFEKPALLYWLQIASYNLFGVNEFAARLGPALFGLGTIVSLWILGRSIERSTAAAENKEQRTTNGFANWLAIIAASTLGIMVFARGASFDIIITFPVTAALVSFFIFDQSAGSSPKKNLIPLILFYFFIGIALLAKGLIGIVFPFATVGLYYLLSRRLPSRAFFISLIWGTLLSLAIASLWYLPMYQRHGYQFIDEFFIQHHFQRFTSNKYQHPQPFYFFLWVLPLMTLPWMPFFLASLIDLFKSMARRVPPRVSPSPLLLFSTAWLLVPLAFFSFSGSKLPGYILPAVPAAVILTAVFVFELVRLSGRWRIAALFIATSSFAGTTLLLIFIVPSFAHSDSVKSLIAAADERGYASNRVLTLHTISHNAEFYAAGRLLRNDDGRQRRLSTNNELLTEINADRGRPVVVLTPLEYLAEVKRDPRFMTEVLKDNGELAVAIVSPK